jgi:predicted nuclease of restriction endonuclease-like (RecB) superfamily
VNRKKPRKPGKRTDLASFPTADYKTILSGVVQILESARHSAARTVNAFMTATYWEIGRRIVEFEQGGRDRSQYGEKLLERLAADLTAKFGRGFGYVNLTQMRRFYLEWPAARILQTPSEESPGTNLQTPSETSHVTPAVIAGRFPLPWSHYVLLLKVQKAEARAFYETEALRQGWSVRQLDRQISTLFYERTLASRKKTTILERGAKSTAQDALTADNEIKDPFLLEFLGLKDEYSESDLEEALIQQLEAFLLELGGDFAFIGRQRRLRIGDEWYRVDLLFFHRKLRCLVVIDLKLGKFTHADAGQMHLYLNYAREHWMNEGENPPVGVILCTAKDHAVAKYALEGLPNKVLAAEYRTTLPDEKTLAAELESKRRLLESRSKPKKGARKHGSASGNPLSATCL